MMCIYKKVSVKEITSFFFCLNFSLSVLNACGIYTYQLINVY